MPRYQVPCLSLLGFHKRTKSFFSILNITTVRQCCDETFSSNNNAGSHCSIVPHPTRTRGFGFEAQFSDKGPSSSPEMHISCGVRWRVFLKDFEKLFGCFLISRHCFPLSVVSSNMSITMNWTRKRISAYTRKDFSLLAAPELLNQRFFLALRRTRNLFYSITCSLPKKRTKLLFTYGARIILLQKIIIH
jgi:hypothetical protein